MYVESIVAVSEQEEALQRRKTEAAAEAKARIATAKERGEQAIIEAKAKAKAELAALRESIDRAATAEADEKLQNTENRKAVLRARAEKAMDAAADFIVERIVTG